MDLKEKRRRIERQCDYLERLAGFARSHLKNFDKQMEAMEAAREKGRHVTVIYLLRGANIQLLRASENVDRVFSLSKDVKEGLTDSVEPAYPSDGPHKITLYRAPCLMEDEGHHYVSGVFTHWEDAREILDVLTDNGTGYFRHGNYYYVSDDAAPPSWPSDCKKGETPTRVL